jgi:uncharacterized alpha-E superfamily protein
VGWRFLSIGRALERADAMAGLLIQFTDADAPEGALDLAVEVGDSVITHQRRYRVRTNRDTVVDLLVLDADNPRAIMFMINELKVILDALPKAQHDGRLGPILRALLPLRTELSVAEPNEITIKYLSELRARLYRVSDLISDQYLR